MPKLSRGLSIILVLLLIAGGLFLIPLLRSTKKQVPPIEIPRLSPSPTRIPIPTPKTSHPGVHSIDGTLQLTIQKEAASGNTMMYSVFVSDIAFASRKLIFTKSAGAGTTITIPPNSWSPDNKYVFLEENDPDGIHALVLKADGSPWSGGEQYLDAKALFEQKVKQFTYDHATGWASPTLIIITTKNGAARGPSFWFEMGSNAFLQLRS